MRNFDVKHPNLERPVRSSRLFLCGLFCLLSLFSTVAWAGGMLPDAKLTADDAAAGDTFGDSVALEGDTVLIGAPFDDDNGTSSGAAYVLTQQAGVWTQEAKLVAEDASFGDVFGSSVALSGDIAVVGAYLDDVVGTNSGAAYVFTRTLGAWTQAEKLIADNLGGGDNFGISVAIDGETIVIGVPGDDDDGLSSGSAVVFTRSTGVWTPKAKLKAEDADKGDQFGTSVAISGGTIVIGAPYHDGVSIDSGAAYVFTGGGNSWTQAAKLTAATGASNDLFGWSVSVSDDTALVGAFRDDQGGNDAGAAYVFSNGGGDWTEVAKLVAEDAAGIDWLGQSVSLDGDTAILGAYGDDDGGSHAGAAYIFAGVGGLWYQQNKLSADEIDAYDYFGYSVAVDGDTLLASAIYDDDGGTDAGAAYLFTAEPPAQLLWETSSSISGTVGGVSYGPEDILQYNATDDSWSMLFDGSMYGISADVNAFSRLDPNTWLLSFAEPTAVPGIAGTVDDSDIVLFRPTVGLFRMAIDGSDVGLDNDDEDINGISIGADGAYLSTVGPFATDTITGGAEDIVRFVPTTVGENTAGTFELELDGSELATPIMVSIDGLSVSGCFSNSYTGYVWLDAHNGSSGPFGITVDGTLSPLPVWESVADYPLELVDALAIGRSNCFVSGPQGDTDLVNTFDALRRR